MKAVSGAGSGLLNNNQNKKPKFMRGLFAGRGTEGVSTIDRYIADSYVKPEIASVFDTTDDNVTTTSKAYNIKTTNTTNNVTNVSNSADLIVMLKGIVKILVKLVDNSDRLKEIVSLLTQLVTTVSTTNTTTSKEQKTATAATLKTNLINTINAASKTNPDKELLDIINSMESLASD